MKLIGAGFPRTGTMSTKVALEQLGFGPCYHFVTQFERPRDIDVWEMLAEGKTVDWRMLFADFHSVVDSPASIFYKQLMEVYPDAKVLLNVRDPNTWYESTLHTVYAVNQMDLSAPRSLILDRIGRMIN